MFLHDYLTFSDGSVDPAQVAERVGAYILSKLPGNVRDQIKDKIVERIDSITEDLLAPVDEDAEEEIECCRNMNSDEENREVDEEEGEIAEQVTAVVEGTTDGGKRRRRNGRFTSIK